ncbi:FAD-dependent oxidoreductase [Paractinoplanes abujensis]|uniref:2-polyprenyl-6-methoxyphenol hydroxylase-like FAD-dependent oxidoreductase n=1 Tax=Paractinoplanes abujensis TaxID=882441 RepID=A0A7W7D043_9ACTN|nr:FAD-dependent monooxygenase [Actinoplanes abujensis]MBB4697862.1 2-polyprenyl-6-methoxyphenol hydroxylase-like FAD-dependent oxidoreductase [Actinoplanes abujensis]GID19654.1 FAD-dependent oxidoreductase [Actinoplanes abujensis]
MRVLISGGGIAGPSLAWWLHRAGADVTVIERAPGPRPGGHAVDVRGTARTVVERMGLMPAVLTDRVDERGVALVDARDRRLASMPSDLFGGEGIVADIEISRGDLSRILLEATATTTDYRYGDRITALRQDDGGVDVTFASGGTERFHIVVGADGVHSGVRALTFGSEPEFVRPLGGYGAYFTVPDPGDLDHWFLMFNAPGGRVAGLRPERGGTAKASLSIRTPERLGRLDRASQKRLLAERFAGVGWRVPSFLAALPGADDFYFDSIDQVRVDRWARGRVVLLGDAGYCGSPLAGLGTSLALVGAYVLAGELAEATSPEAAYAAYQSTMAAYVADGIQLPPGGMAAFAPNSRLTIRLRALSMNSMSRWPMKHLLAGHFTKAEAITLKDYAALTPNL